MALKVYIGARYTPKFEGEWKANKEYAALSVVYSNNKSYVSRKTVPAGTAVTETEFWVESADWNAQVEQYNQNVTQYKAQVDTYQNSVENYTEQVNQFYADTLHSYETRDEMIADTNIKLGDTLLTCGKDAIGDGGGSFYQVVNTQSQKTVVLANGLYAEPFEFQPYDYAAFEQKVDEYKADVDQQLDEVEQYSLRNYDTTNKMVADRSLMTGNTVLTSGENSVGDGQGSFWKVVDQNSSDATALANGKYAKPFQLNPYDASNYVIDILDTNSNNSRPPCYWVVTEKTPMPINLGVLPNHTSNGITNVNCKLFLFVDWYQKLSNTMPIEITHGGYGNNPLLQYKFNIDKDIDINQAVVCVQIVVKATDDGYTSVSNSFTVVSKFTNSYTPTTTSMLMYGDTTKNINWDGKKVNTAAYKFTTKKDLSHFSFKAYTILTSQCTITKIVTNSEGTIVFKDITEVHDDETGGLYNLKFDIYGLPADTYSLNISVSAGQFNKCASTLIPTNNNYINTKPTSNFETISGKFISEIDVIPAGTYVIYGDTMHTVIWKGALTSDTNTYYFDVNAEKCDVKLMFNTTVRKNGLSGGDVTFTLKNSSNSEITSTTVTTAIVGGTRLKEITLTANNLMKGKYSITISPNKAKYSLPMTYGEVITNKYINVQPNTAVAPLLAQYTISNVTE